MNISALGNVWNSAIMNSSNEVINVGRLALQHSQTQDINLCGHFYGLTGSTNVPLLTNFGFSGYNFNSNGM